MNAILRLIILIAFAFSSIALLSGCGKAEYERRLDASVKKYSAMKQPKVEDDYEDDYDAVDPADVEDDNEETDDDSTDDEESDDGESPFNNEEE